MMSHMLGEIDCNDKLGFILSALHSRSDPFR